MNIFERIHENEEKFSPKQRIIADYILTNYKKAAFMNSVELARTLNTSNPTIIRFAASLGYSGFPEFQADLQKLVYNNLDTVGRVQNLPLSDSTDYISSIFQCEINNLEQAYHSIDRSCMEQAVDLMVKSHDIYVIGELAFESLASYTSYTLAKIHPSVHLLHEPDFSAFQSWQENQSACALVFAFPRFANQVIQLIQSLNQKQIPIILVTNSRDFPLSHLTEVQIIVPLTHFVFLDPLAAPLCIANCLIMGVFEKTKQLSIKQLNLFEEYAKFNQLFTSVN